MAEHPVTLSDRVRAFTGVFMSRLGGMVASFGIHPDSITIVGLIVVAGAALLIGKGELRWGGVLLLLGLPLDAVDGAVARAMKRKGNFGQMLDSTLDRYADGLIFAALSYHFAVQDEYTLILLALAALLGSFMVSYTRARAEGIGVVVKIGYFSRLERVVFILAMLLAPEFLGLPVLEIGLWVLAIGTNFTGVQRLWYVYRALEDREG